MELDLLYRRGQKPDYCYPLLLTLTCCQLWNEELKDAVCCRPWVNVPALGSSSSRFLSPTWCRSSMPVMLKECHPSYCWEYHESMLSSSCRQYLTPRERSPPSVAGLFICFIYFVLLFCKLHTVSTGMFPVSVC